MSFPTLGSWALYMEVPWALYIGLQSAPLIPRVPIYSLHGADILLVNAYQSRCLSKLFHIAPHIGIDL